MRLNFNIVLVDDELDDEDHKEAVEELIKYVSKHVEDKGFYPIFHSFKTVEIYKKEIPVDVESRIDLFLSDNNLGTGEQGIAFYINLTDTGIHDFVLYTRDPKRSIVDELVSHLDKSEDPNLFSRFTFVERDTDSSWMEPIEDVIDHILSKREQINNLRGLYAQEMSKVENHLCKILKVKSGDLIDLINDAFKLKKIDEKFKKVLHTQRCRRNGIIHNDEEFCKTENKWFVTYEVKVKGAYRTKRVYENEFVKIRKDLNDAVKQTMQCS